MNNIPHIVDTGASVMKDEPVAWTDGRGNYFDKNSFFPVNDLTPLYIHPVKTLTDDEIQDLIDYVAEKPTDEDLYDFAKAILRKVKK
jgi:hypothetical protein